MDTPQNNEEINLADFFKVVAKRKKIIISFFILSMVVILALSFSLTGKLSYTTYSANALFKIGLLGDNNLIESPDQLSEEINQGLYGNYSSLNSSYTSNNLVPSRLVNLSITLPNKEEAEKNILTVSDAILKEHAAILNAKKEEINAQIHKIENLSKFSGNNQSYQLKIIDLQANLQEFQPSQLIEKSFASTSVDNRKKIIFDVIIGLVVSIFISLAAAFFKEWWDNNKSTIMQYF